MNWNLDTSIDNLRYVLYMEEQENKSQESKVERPGPFGTGNVDHKPDNDEE